MWLVKESKKENPSTKYSLFLNIYQPAIAPLQGGEESPDSKEQHTG
jgi:hypothetical protein